MRSTNPRGYLIFFLVKFLVEWRHNHVWGPIFDPSYDHIYKNIHFCKGKGTEEGRKEGRGEGRVLHFLMHCFFCLFWIWGICCWGLQVLGGIAFFQAWNFMWNASKIMFGDMVARYMPNSDPWGSPWTPFMTIFVFYVNPQIPNIEYFEAHEVYKSREVSHLLSHQISLRMPSESCLGSHFWP